MVLNAGRDSASNREGRLSHRSDCGLFVCVCFFVCVFPSVCTTQTEKVCKSSSEENLQPFKDETERFLIQGQLGSLRIERL